MRRKLGGLAAAIVAATALTAGAATPASAFTNVYLGTPIDFVQTTGAFGIGTAVTCTTASFDGPVSNDPYPVLGGQVAPPAVTFSGCLAFGSAATVTSQTPWTIVFGTSGVSVSGVSLRVQWGTLNCTYQGTLSGAYSDTTGNWDISSTLTRTLGATLCPSAAAVTETIFAATPHNLPVVR